jgi:hypothetical protein
MGHAVLHVTPDVLRGSAVTQRVFETTADSPTGTRIGLQEAGALGKTGGPL